MGRVPIIVAEMGSVELMKRRRRRRNNNNNSRACLGEDDFEQDVVALGEALVEGEVLLDLGIVVPPKQLHVPLHDFQSQHLHTSSAAQEEKKIFVYLVDVVFDRGHRVAVLRRVGLSQLLFHRVACG